MDTEQLKGLLTAQERVIKKIALGVELHETLTCICEQIELIIGSPDARSSILLLNGEQLHHGAAPRLPDVYCEAIDGVVIGPIVGSCGTAAFKQQPVIVTDIEHDPLWVDFKDFALEHELRACWSTPIFSSKKQVIGTFAIYYNKVKAPDDYHQKLIDRFTNLSSLAIEKNLIESEKYQAEEKEKKALAIKSEFLANMSHEIRTPMNGVLGMVSLLQGTEMTEEQNEMIETISSSGDSLLRILNDILDASKIESGNLELEITSFSLKDCVEQVLHLNSHAYKKKKLDVTVSINEKLPEYFYGDITRIKQILLNYLSNAIKFTQIGGAINLTIEADSIEQSDYTIKFSVSDTGIGISQENQKNLFLAFNQADSSITRKYGGTGLGLAICSNLVKLMNGSFDLISEEGKGAKFSFTILLKRSDEGTISENEINYDKAAKCEHKILVVEDNAVNQQIVRMMLKKLGFDCDVANDGQEALDLISTLKAQSGQIYSIVFMDIQMPVLDGIEATRLIIENNPEDHPVIVAMTANAFPEDKNKCFDVGMQGFISKPMKITDISRVLSQFGDSHC